MLADSLSRLDHDRAAFLATFDALTPAQRQFRPSDGGWTADEVAQHLVKAETGTLAILAKQVAAGDARRAVPEASEERLAAVEAFLRSDGLTTMPASAEPFIRPDSPPGAGWRDRLAAFESEWHHLAEALPDALADVPLMEHPRAGGLTAAGAARFMSAHLDHHRRQLERIQAAPGYPASAPPG
ncbi:MAG TPA: DinB family protein [Rubricoccaceae bacterium]|jgi:hypothetical protein